METKKNSKVNLENYRATFFLVGMLLALLTVFITISHTNADASIKDIGKNGDVNIDEELYFVPNTPPVELPPPPKEIVSQTVEIVPDEIKIKDGFDFICSDPDDIDWEEYEYITFDPPEEDDEPLGWVPQMPEFPGGEPALLTFVANNVEYPQLAIDNGIEGTVYVRFVVSKTGKVQNPQIARGVDPLLDDEALRVIKKLPDFKPGMQDGRAVSVWFRMPIVFELR